MGVPKGAGNLRGARDKNWTVVAACLRSFRRALTAVHPEPARGPTLVTSATQLKIGEPCEFSAKPLNSPKFLDVTLRGWPTNFGVSPPLHRTRGISLAAFPRLQKIAPRISLYFDLYQKKLDQRNAEKEAQKVYSKGFEGGMTKTANREDDTFFFK